MWDGREPVLWLRVSMRGNRVGSLATFDVPDGPVTSRKDECVALIKNAMNELGRLLVETLSEPEPMPPPPLVEAEPTTRTSRRRKQSEGEDAAES